MGVPLIDRTKVGDRMMAVLAMAGLSHPQARVLAAIAWHDASGGARPSLATIGAESGMAERTARSHVQALIGKGVLSTRRRRRGPPIYLIDYDWQASKAPAKPAQDRPTTGQSKTGDRDAKTGRFARSKTGRPPATEREGTKPSPLTPLPSSAEEEDAEQSCAPPGGSTPLRLGEAEQKQPSAMTERYCGACDAPIRWNVDMPVWLPCAACGAERVRFYDQPRSDPPPADTPSSWSGPLPEPDPEECDTDDIEAWSWRWLIVSHENDEIARNGSFACSRCGGPIAVSRNTYGTSWCVTCGADGQTPEIKLLEYRPRKEVKPWRAFDADFMREGEAFLKRRDANMAKLLTLPSERLKGRSP